MKIRLLALIACLIPLAGLRADDPQLRESQQTAVRAVDARADELRAVNQAIWEFAEVGLEEQQSSALLMQKLKQAGFEVRAEVAGMPTAFVASYGSGHPIIGILAEYDALPELSQKVSPEREPVEEGRPGHGCGHSGLGTGALGAAMAVKEAMEKHDLKGTIHLYGTPAEETLIGKVYMLLDGEFKDLDVCLHWHPGTKHEVWSGSSKAMVSVKFTFHGTAAHASGSPDSGRSALDAVELMNVGVNYMREHVKEDARMHYVITNGGGQPNVVPPTATVWYFIRADKHQDVERYFEWVRDIAEGAAKMTRTKMTYQIDTDCHELIPNTPLAELVHRSFVAVGPPKYSEKDIAFARRLQESLKDESGKRFPVALETEVQSLKSADKLTKGSTDVGDISWFVPTIGVNTTCFAAESPGHSWQNVASIGSSIGETGIIYAAKVLAATAIDLLEHPDLITAAKADFDQRMKDREYTTLIPEGQKPPVRIR